MSKLHLQIITPERVVMERDIDAISVPSKSGEITVLPRHASLFSVLDNGIVKIKHDADETFFSIGAGYIETDGISVRLLVSRAAAQDELDVKDIEDARRQAERYVRDAKTKDERAAALASLRRSAIDLKLYNKTHKKRQNIS